ncbi:MAG: hypothetical protein MJ105_01550 [Lachnospiraceae bacterium]|nr:hypothetical protein [Lachnospiraceae bacterium]
MSVLKKVAIVTTIVATGTVVAFGVIGGITGRFSKRAGRDRAIYDVNGDARFESDLAGDISVPEGAYCINPGPLNDYLQSSMQYSISVPFPDMEIIVTPPPGPDPEPDPGPDPGPDCDNPPSELLPAMQENVTYWSRFYCGGTQNRWPMEDRKTIIQETKTGSCAVRDEETLSLFGEYLSSFDFELLTGYYYCFSGYNTFAETHERLSLGSNIYFLVFQDADYTGGRKGQSGEADSVYLCCFDTESESNTWTGGISYIELPGFKYSYDDDAKPYDYHLVEDAGNIYIVGFNNMSHDQFSVYVYTPATGKLEHEDYFSGGYNLNLSSGCVVEADRIYWLTLPSTAEELEWVEKPAGSGLGNYYAQEGVVSVSLTSGQVEDCPELETRTTLLQNSTYKNAEIAEYLLNGGGTKGDELAKNNYGLFRMTDQGIIFRPRGTRESMTILPVQSEFWNIDGSYLYYVEQRSDGCGYTLYRKNYMNGPEMGVRINTEWLYNVDWIRKSVMPSSSDYVEVEAYIVNNIMRDMAFLVVDNSNAANRGTENSPLYIILGEDGRITLQYYDDDNDEVVVQEEP